MALPILILPFNIVASCSPKGFCNVAVEKGLQIIINKKMITFAYGEFNENKHY
jgi:hypothetical protein